MKVRDALLSFQWAIHEDYLVRMDECDQEITADLNTVATLPGGTGVQHGGRLLARVLGSDQWVVLTLNPTDSTLTIWVDNGAANARGELGTRTATLHREGVLKLRKNWIYKAAIS